MSKKNPDVKSGFFIYLYIIFFIPCQKDKRSEHATARINTIKAIAKGMPKIKKNFFVLELFSVAIIL